MGIKQDSVYPRTAAQLERQYNFGKSFAEVRGVALDAQTHAYNAEKSVKEWSQRVESELGDVYAELVMRVETDENDNLIGKLHIGANQLTINTDNFTLDEDGNVEIEGVIRAKSGGMLGLWDISEESIFKYTDNHIFKISAPTADDADVITVATRTSTTITGTPLSIKANGNIFTKGIIESANEAYTRYTTIDKGIISISGDWKATHDIYVRMLLMKFLALDGVTYGLYANGYRDDTQDTLPIIWTGISVDTAI